MEDLLALATKGGPIFYAATIGLLVLIWRSIEGVKDSLKETAIAQIDQAAAMRDQADALEHIVQGNMEVIRMMEKFQAASAERHVSNTDKLNLLLQHRGGRREQM